MKIEWWCEPAPSTPGHVALLARVDDSATFCSCFSWHPEYAKPTKSILTIAFNSIEHQLNMVYGAARIQWWGMPDKQDAIEADIFYLQGLLTGSMNEGRRLVILDEHLCAKPHKFSAPTNKGPRGRWGNA